MLSIAFIAAYFCRRNVATPLLVPARPRVYAPPSTRALAAPLTPQEFALKKLYAVVDYHWAEIAEEVSLIESLYETPEFKQRELAAALASKVGLPWQRVKTIKCLCNLTR